MSVYVLYAVLAADSRNRRRVGRHGLVFDSCDIYGEVAPHLHLRAGPRTVNTRFCAVRG